MTTNTDTHVCHLRLVALTGGPGGGKSTLMRELREDDPRSDRWLLAPEAAPLLFQAGLRAQARSFQVAVVRLQIALEEACVEVAVSIGCGQVLVCHRGTMDALGYWLYSGWAEDEFFSRTAMSRGELFGRYNGVIHLQSTAIGAEVHYRRWPEAHRPETLEQAAAIDRMCGRVWEAHPRYIKIANTGKGWLEKSHAAKTALSRWLAFENR